MCLLISVVEDGAEGFADEVNDYYDAVELFYLGDCGLFLFWVFDVSLYAG